MCGFFFSTTKKLLASSRLLNLRGPDRENFEIIEGFYYHHCLLDISNKFYVQPYKCGSIVVLFNGEFYDLNEELDTPDIATLYNRLGSDFISELRGEFSIVLVDYTNKLIHVYSDVFATKPLYYSLDGGLHISSYCSILKKSGVENIVEVRRAEHLTFNFESGLIDKRIYHEFNCEEFDTDYSKTFKTLEDAVEKRIRVKQSIFLGLSSGYDSGVLLSCLLSLKIPFNAYSLKSPKEDLGILEKRRKLCENSNISFKYLNSNVISDALDQLHLNYNVESLTFEQEVQGSIVTERPSLGYMLICRSALQDGCKIFLSGQGGDEILSNYNRQMDFSNILSKFPWKHFYDNKQRDYIKQVDHISGSLGIESRFPFLDRDFVQSFLNLKTCLKNDGYKQVFFRFLEEKNMPFLKDAKVGIGVDF